MGSADPLTSTSGGQLAPGGVSLPTRTWLWLVYTLLIVYGSLYPLNQWDWSEGGLNALLTAGMPEPPPLRDVVINILVYIPFGLLTAALLHSRLATLLAVSTLTGLALSLSMEFAQTWLPVRITSFADLVLNGIGTLTGALAAVLLLGAGDHQALVHPGGSPRLRRLAASLAVTAGTVQQNRAIQLVGVVLLGGLYAYLGLQATPADNSLKRINLVLFRNQVNHPSDMIDLLAIVLIFIAMAFLLAPVIRRKRGLLAVFTGLACFGFGLEYLKTQVPGTAPDITLPLVALTAWLLTIVSPGLGHIFKFRRHTRDDNQQSPPPTSTRRPKMVLLVAGLTIVLVILWASRVTDPRHQPAPYQLPPLDVLPTPEFPAFRDQHPRLPAPSPTDLAALDEGNPVFWQQHREDAARGSLYSRILLLHTGRGNIDRAALFADLMALEPAGRGHRQTEPLALALDWLYSEWSDTERKALIAKVAGACRHQMTLIRDHYRLSPYNAILYNRPLQALMAASIASHGHTEDSECMRFTADYWRYRVIPVWQQVMGRHGGWHEGGEYLGVGLGQALYQLPAMWRHATGEDLFPEVPGLRGMLDFAIHRTRPDGRQIRQGSATHLEQRIPDLAALALEFGHQAAYRFASPPEWPEPLAYPWGPLSGSAWRDQGPTAPPLPTHAYFDGIGLLTARSGWHSDASMVTFKAGNNYWSHAHLDQGTFTVFKQGALVINSGLSGPAGNADHMVNYTRQSIAHNVITVTDPLDTVPMPPREHGQSPRPIANDGGQRRVGSGWGLPAPMDHLERRRLQHIYQTVGDTLEGVDDGVVWKVADLTPAYTNIDSGKGDFSARTLRVRRYLRTFIYDPDSELIVVHDQVQSVDPTFDTRWLLHSVNEPILGERSFQIRAHSPEHQATGGQLRGRVLLPLDARLGTVGDPGYEFHVDGNNFDENGAVQRIAAERPHPDVGSWRLEVAPTDAEAHSEFLVVMGVAGPEVDYSLPATILETENGITLTIEGEPSLIIRLPDGVGPVTVERQP